MTNLPGPESAGKKNLPGFRTPRAGAPAAQQPAIVTQPQTYADLKQGIDWITEEIRPTLGPLPRLVALARASSSEAPEILD
ncbi:MAG: hypothetical protein KJZ93_14790, partial [Caldilineaceae bacterium]|nr:hypothetical protein [Caldilineaceae bacterium]